MTHPNFVTNGASLEDCHTNFFALADLCGIKWRRYYAESGLCYEPLDDPVLSSYSKCLSTDILCVWRRVPNPERQRHNQQDGNHLNYKKELWVFWYGEEPDITGLVSPDLTADLDQGSWEIGLSYECRTLLFKSLHNLMTRNLLTKGYALVGKWFVLPYEPGCEVSLRRSQFSFSFNFFIHGESTVCVSLDVRQRIPVCHLSRQHLSLAQASLAGLKVILCPYGMAGTLTGHGYKDTDLSIQRSLNEWSHFYPVRPKCKNTSLEDDHIMPAVEVIVGGTRMRYPSNYVIVTELDENAAIGPNTAQFPSSFYPHSSNSASTSHQRASQFGSSVLTPPTSPGDPSLASNCSFRGHPLGPTSEIFGHNYATGSRYTTAWRIKEAAWQDSATQGRGKEDGGVWEFSDPSSLARCDCTRLKTIKEEKPSIAKLPTSTSSPSPAVTTSSPAASVDSPCSATNAATNSARKNDKPDKLKQQTRYRTSIPFHKRSTFSDAEMDGFAAANYVIASMQGAPVTNSVSATNFQFKSLALRSSTPSGLPQLHTSVVQPQSLGSPHPGTPLASDGASSQSTEPAMPTLSPHPPSVKEEVVEATAESQDQSGVIAAAQSPATGGTLSAAGSEASGSKDKVGTDQVSSPFPNNVATVVENIKNEIKSEDSPSSQPNSVSNGSNNWTPAPEEMKSNTTAPSSVPPTPASASAAVGLKRPSLTVCSHEDPRDELVMDGLLYDYTFLNSSLWENPPGKRRKLWPTARLKTEHPELMDLYSYGKDGCNPMQIDDSLSLKQKDPYEFNDEFDEDSPSSSSVFRRMDEEDIKIKDPNLPPTPDSQILTPGQVISAPLTPIQDPPKPPSNGEQPVSSPLTPRNQNSSFTSERDLQVTDKDLDNLFESSSSDDSVDDVDPSTPMSAKLCGTPEEPSSGKSKNNSYSSGMLCAAELTRMFPTPPSLEHNTAQSPSGPFNTDLSTIDGSECYRDRSDGYLDGGCSPYYEPVKDWSFVYKLNIQHKFVGSKRYAPLSTLPSQVQPVPISTDHVYKPSWTNAVTSSPLPANTTTTNSQAIGYVERLPPNSNSQFPMMPVNEVERIVPPMYSVEPPIDQRTLPMSYELQSPASNASSYMNKHLNSVDSSGTASTLPEAHTLIVNLVLSDSMLNLFKDHNFASCGICVCNMNTKGADAGINLPSSLIPAGEDEPQYKCTCGFSAVVNRHQSHRSGIFYEDELDITGHRYETYSCRKSLALVESGQSKKAEPGLEDEINPQVDLVPHNVVDLIRQQCSQIHSTFSMFHKAEQFRLYDRMSYQYNALEIADGNEVCFLALETGRQAIDNMNNSKMDESLKSSCLHKWPYLSAKVPVSNLDVVQLLRSLQPTLQEAVQQRRHHRMWEVTYPVLGPLTWRQFHRLAGRGTEDQCEPQPIPSLLVGHDKDWVALSPFALKFWDKLLLEPYTNSRDIAYIVVAPDSDCVLTPVKKYFKELSTIYELCKLGRHCPITKVLRDGIMRVGKGTVEKLADEPVDEWFNLIGNGPVANRLKLYAQACRYHLAPHLATQPFDSTLIDAPPVLKPPDKPPSVPSPRTTPGAEGQEKEPQTFKTEPDSKSDVLGGGSSDPPSTSTANPDSGDAEDNQQTPTVVIYLVEPFTHSSADPDVYRLASLGLLRSYTHMLQFLPEHIRNNSHLQVITLDSILSLGRMENSERRKDQLKALAFSVFSQCHQMSTHQTIAKSLTGFGPAAAQDMFLKSRDARSSILSPPPSKVFTLAPQKDKQTELGEMFGDRREKSSVLYCTYCLTEDQRWLVASCTDDKGDLLQTCCISIEVPNRTRRKKATVRRLALHKLLDFIVEVLSKCLHAWRLVISRLGRLGHGELRDWASLLSRKSLLRYSRQLRDLCHQCAVLGTPPDTPAILSACLVSLEPDSALRVMSDQFTPDDRFSSSCNSCGLSTPEDASCTHILVFPTSATTQSSQATFQQEHIDPLSTTLADDDIFQALNDDDIAVGQDINDIFRWTESPPQSPNGGSPRRDSISQPGSPSCGMGGRHSPFHHGGPNRSSGNLSMDTQEEPLQLHLQPLALGYYVSTAKTGPLPKWFWSTCPQLQNVCPVFLKSALLIHSPFVQQNSDDLLHANPQARNYHPLDSNLTTDVLRYVLEGFNSLSWLSLDPSNHDRRSCLPVHIQMLMQLYQAVEALI